MLTFIFVQTLNLDVENGVRVNLDTGTRFHKRRQTHFVIPLDGAVLFAELRVVCVFFQVDQLVQIVGPLFFSVLSSRPASSGLHCLIQRRGVMPLVTLWNLVGHSW